MKARWRFVVLVAIQIALPKDSVGGGFVGLAVGGALGDRLRVEDVSPVAHGDAGGSIQVGFAGETGWRASIRSGLYGGSTAVARLGRSATIRDRDWRIALLIGREIRVGGITRLGIAFGPETSDYRSWLDVDPQPSDGPRVRSWGGVAEFSVAHPIGRSIHLRVALDQAVWSSKATVADQQAKWLANILTLNAGLEFRP